MVDDVRQPIQTPPGCNWISIPARDVAVGDVLRINDWRLHVVGVERDFATAVLTAEFGFLLHFTHDDVVDVLRLALAA
jgi:hypothetical protein